MQMMFVSTSQMALEVVFKSAVLGLLKNCNWTGPRLQKIKADQ